MILTTGVKSGLGKFIFERLKGEGISRETCAREIARLKKRKLQAIIHCAFNPLRAVNSQNLYGYLEDNLFLTRSLLSLSYEKFIYLSSVDVYPKDNLLHSEAGSIELDKVSGLYALTKLMAESIIRQESRNYLIIRASALLGRDSRKNSLMKIMEGRNCSLTLSGDSVFNYVLHSDVLDFIKLAIEKDIRGTYNLASSGNILLKEVAKMLKAKVSFGKYRYDSGSIDNRRIISVLPSLKRGSKETIRRFISGIK